MKKKLTPEMVEDSFSVYWHPHNGALELTALCLDTHGHASFYKTKTFYGYELSEAKMRFAEELLNDESIAFVFGIREWEAEEVK
jgi:hypothetical protein